MGRTQVLFYYSGDGNWWLGDLTGGQLHWSLVSQTGRPYGHRVRLLIKILQTPTIAIDTMVTNMQTVYDTVDVLVDEGTRENLTVTDANGTVQLDFNVAPCNMGQTPTADQTLLFANRNNAGTNDVVAYFVRSTTPPLNGCAAFPAGQPGAVITQGASPWTLAHEIGHVLGLSHLSGENTGCPASSPNCCSTPDFTRLMTGCGTGNITGTPTLTTGEGSTVQSNANCKRC